MIVQKEQIGKRLHEVISQLKVANNIKSIKQLAADCGMTPAAISEMTSGRNHVSQHLLQHLVDHYKVNGNYVVRGELPMFFTRRPNGGERPLMVFNDYSFQGDAGIFEDETGRESVGFMYDADFKDCTCALIISGDEMEPEFQRGNKLLLKRVNDMAIVQYGKPYVVITGELLLFRYLHKVSNEPGMWSLRAGSKKYDNIDLSIDDVKALYLVRGALRRVS